MFNKFQHFVSSKRCGRRLCRFFSLPWWFWTRTETSAGPVSSRASDTGRDITATTRSRRSQKRFVIRARLKPWEMRFEVSILAFELCWPSAMNLWNTDMNNCPLVETCRNCKSCTKFRVISQKTMLSQNSKSCPCNFRKRLLGRCKY